MNKEELITIIQDKHRQLERYLFYFEKNSDGVFVASDRPKFGINEMLNSCIIGDWSLKDLLSHLIDWEQRFLQRYQAGLEGEVPGELPLSEFKWDDIDPNEMTIPGDLRTRSIDGVISEFKRSYECIVSTVGSISEEALFTSRFYTWTGEALLADYIALSTYRHYEWAKKHINHWRKRHAGEYLNKRVVLERMKTEHRRLVQNLDQLGVEQFEMAGVVGEWTVKDVLAHLADWEQRFIGWYEAGVRGETPEIPAPGLGWEELDLLNQRIFEKNRDRELKDVRKEFDASYKQVLALVEGITEEEMFEVGRYAWLGKNNLVGVILANTANHYRWAKSQIRGWIG